MHRQRFSPPILFTTMQTNIRIQIMTNFKLPIHSICGQLWSPLITSEHPAAGTHTTTNNSPMMLQRAELRLTALTCRGHVGVGPGLGGGVTSCLGREASSRGSWVTAGLRRVTAGLRGVTAGLRGVTAGLRGVTAGLRRVTAGLRGVTAGLGRVSSSGGKRSGLLGVSALGRIGSRLGWISARGLLIRAGGSRVTSTCRRVSGVTHLWHLHTSGHLHAYMWPWSPKPVLVN